MDMIPIMDIVPASNSMQVHNSGAAGENLSGVEPAGEKFESVLTENSSVQGQAQPGNRVGKRVDNSEGSITDRRKNAALSQALPGKRENIPVKETHSADLSALMIFLGMLNQQINENNTSIETGVNESGTLAEADFLFSGLLDDSGYVREGTVEELLSSIKKLISGNSEGMNPQALQEEFDSLFSALMNSGKNISTKVQDGVGLKADTGKEIHTAIQDNQAHSGLKVLQWKLAGAEAENTGQNTESGEAAASGDGSGVPASSLNDRRSGREISLDSGKSFQKTVTTEQGITDQVNLNAESRARHEASASNAVNKEDRDYLDLKSAVNGRAERSMKADTVLTDMEPRWRSEKNNTLSQTGGDAVKSEDRAGTARITQSGSGSADHDSPGNSHGKSALIIDFNSGNHKSAHKGFSLQAAEGESVQNATHTAPSEFTAIKTGSVSNDIKITSLSDSARAGVLDQVGQGISTAVAMNRNRAVIHLNPPELGSVTIRLHVDHNNHVRASFMAEHVHTHQLIESGMESLKSQLAQNGFDLGQVNVNLAGGGMHDPGSSRRHETGTGGKGVENTIKEDDGEAVLDASASGHGIHDHGSGVHIIM